MFISFFTGKVILFFGISLIMKEKSNASALHLGRDTLASGTRFGRVWDEIRSHAGRCAPKSISDGTWRPDGLPRIDEKLM